MPKFEAIIVMRVSQHVTFEAANMDEAKRDALAAELWDWDTFKSKPLDDLNTEFSMQNVERVNSKQTDKE
jgi:hypothetical protein